MKRLKEIGTMIFAIMFLVLIPAIITFSPLYIAISMRDFIYLSFFLITWLPAILTIRFAEFVLGKII
jgi:hypothetical protein